MQYKSEKQLRKPWVEISALAAVAVFFPLLATATVRVSPVAPYAIVNDTVLGVANTIYYASLSSAGEFVDVGAGYKNIDGSTELEFDVVSDKDYGTETN